MIQWRFSGTSPALNTQTGVPRAGGIKVSGNGCALYGPYVDVPAGQLTARVRIADGARGKARIEIAGDCGARIWAARDVDLAQENSTVTLAADLTELVRELEVRLQGNIDAQIEGLEIDLSRDGIEPPQPDREVGYESKKTYAKKVESGFWKQYFSGPAVLELGYKGYYGATVPIVPQAIGVDVGYPGYDGVRLPFADESFDAIYSSHCLEHIPDYAGAIRDWYRLLKVGGYMMIVVPQQHLFEKRAIMPSLVNPDHHRFYTADSLLRELTETLPENSFRVRHMRENDEGFDYSIEPRLPGHGCFEIEVVIEKLRKPNWNSDDNTVRNYSAGEFMSEVAKRPNPWVIEIDFAQTDQCVAFGPYTPLRPADYVAEFHFVLPDLATLGDPALALDVARDATRVTHIELGGPDGLNQLRSGVVSVPFSVSATGFYEFRIYRHGAAQPGTVRFRGVRLRYA